MKCRNRVYSVTQNGIELYLCRLHFSYAINEQAFREYPSYPIREEDKQNMQLLYDLHDRSKP